MRLYQLFKSDRKDKKFYVIPPDLSKKIYFGASDYEDYTIHKDKDRMERYLGRHRENEDWTKNGIKSAGFWSRWILWNLPNLEESIKDTEKRFNIKIIYK